MVLRIFALMRIATWNCNMSFRTKAEFVLVHQIDLLVVPECEEQDKLKFKSATMTPNQILWFGTNPNKGLGIFSYSDYKLKLLDEFNPDVIFYFSK